MTTLIKLIITCHASLWISVIKAFILSKNVSSLTTCAYMKGRTTFTIIITIDTKLKL